MLNTLAVVGSDGRSIKLGKESFREHQLSDLLALLSDMQRKWDYPEPNLHRSASKLFAILTTFEALCFSSEL